jgi:peptide/nickel transport system substrate-binding protein
MSKISRREFVKVSTLAAAGTLIAACAKTSTEEPAPTAAQATTAAATATPQPTAAPEAAKEAPQLVTKVGAGELPPYEDRLPAEPMVVVRENPGFTQEIGTYGEKMQLGRAMGWQSRSASVLRLGPDTTETIPHLAKAWEYAEDGTGVTVFFRRGTKWNDGEPFTVDDVLFWYEDYVSNEEFYPIFPSQWRPGGEPATFTKVDDYTVQVQFSVPTYYMEHRLDNTGGRGSEFEGSNGFYFPSHYLKEYHIDYNPDAGALATAEGFESWDQIFSNRIVRPSGDSTLGVPVMEVWTKTEDTASAQTWVRNPYMWLVDPAGNQLPYIDTCYVSKVTDTETVLMMILAGEIDFEGWGISVGDWPTVFDGQDKGGYDLWMGKDYWASAAAFQLNQTYALDDDLRDIFRDKRFRQALSYAIDRGEINEKVYLGMATPCASTPNKICPWYKDEWTTLHATYDPDKANELLDEMGLTNRDDEGYRTKPNGDRLEVVIECTDTYFMWVPSAELSKSYWEAVGVRTIVKLDDSDLLWTRRGSNEQQIFTWVNDGMGPNQLLSANMSYPGVAASPLWNQWRSSAGESGEQPPAELVELIEWCDQVTQTPLEEVIPLAQKIWDRALENVYLIGTCGYAGKPCITNKKLGNVDQNAYGDNWDCGGTLNNWLEVFFWKEA